MKKNLYLPLLAVLLIFFTAVLSAQPVTATWTLTNATQTSVVTTGIITGENQTITGMAINGWSGNNTAAKLYSTTGGTTQTGYWPDEKAYNPARYAEYKVTPKSGNTIVIDNISFDIGNSGGSNNLRADFFYSLDNFATSKKLGTTDTLPNTAMHKKTFTGLGVTITDGKVLSLRIFPWGTNGGAASGKYTNIQNVIISGTALGILTPMSASWPYETDDKAVTKGSITANQSYYKTMKFYGFTNLPTVAGVTLKVGSIQTASKTWYAEPKPTDTLYFQYEVAPKAGGTMVVNSVSMYLGGWFSSNLRAAIYYSKDANFSNRTLLLPDSALVGNKVDKLQMSLNSIVNSGETFYLRVYPHNKAAEGWAKLVAVDSVLISGSTGGVKADPPAISTSPATYISNTYLTIGGTVANDGGADVTARGVCWNTTGNPTIADNKTVNGNGVGLFVSNVTNLTAGTKYYFKAYATNSAGTAYGSEINVTTLSAVVIPTVTTTSASSILAKTANTGGNVTDWGGAPVTEKGVCYSTSPTPTIINSKTSNGNDIGTFTSGLYNLNPNTKYYVRAYATNSVGTGYGPEISFTTQSIAPPVRKVVALDGSGDYKTVQAAFDAVPENYTGTYTIFVKKGTYYEKITLASNKPNVVLIGEDRDATILTYDDYAGKPGLGTSTSQSVAIDANDFVAMNITFRNTIKNDGSQQNQQAVALRVNGDRQAYYNCKMLGYQDTYYTWGNGRIYNYNCYIEGTVDFIFGRSITVFEGCTIKVLRNGCTITAASTEPTSLYGYVFLSCSIQADKVGFDGTAITNIYLGRPWQANPRTVFLGCEEPEVLNSAGWQAWNVNPALYAEYACYGAGYKPSQRVTWSNQLTLGDATQYSLSKIFSKAAGGFAWDWTPDMLTTGIQEEKKAESLPTKYSLEQNYPNPFNPSTKIKYQVPNNGLVKITVYDITGREVTQLVNSEHTAGFYEVDFNAFQLASGVYFYRIQASNFVQTKKMILVK